MPRQAHLAAKEDAKMVRFEQDKLGRWALTVLCAFALATLPLRALAQPYPTKRITIIVPTSPGSGPDIWARILAENLKTRLGQTVIVENRPGGGNLIGAVAVARAAPDGYTLLVCANTLGTAAHMFGAGGIGGVDVSKDLTPFITLGISPAVIVVKSSLGVKSLDGLVALAKRPPGLTYVSSGTGTLLHMFGELFNRSAGIKMMHIPEPGFSQAIEDLIGGRVNVLFAGYAAVAQFLKADDPDKLIALGIINHGRSPVAPEIPTLDELGYKNVDAVGWYGVYAPTGTPPAVIATLNQEINAILKLTDVKARGVSTGLEVTGGTAEDAAARYVKDYEVFGKVIEEAGIAQH
jgi:tripartite-type tricarboxylate transporter receptor subunit TctC